MADILERYSNPSYGGRPAGRLDAVLHDPARSRDLVVNWIFTQTKLSIMRGNVITPQLFLLICKRVSIEALLHDSLGLPASLHRAGCLFEKERGLWEQEHGRAPSRRIWPQLWDAAVRRHMAGSMRKLMDGRTKTIRWLPLADGRCSNPDKPYPMSCGGLDAWMSVIHRPRARELDAMDVPPADPRRTVEPFRPDTEWAERHGVDPSRITGMDSRELDDMNVDASALEPTPAPSARFAALDLIVQDHDVAAGLDAEEGCAVDILARHGMCERCARTGIVYERLLRDDPRLGREAAWRRACRMLEACRPGSAARGDGLGEYLHEVADLLAEYHPPLAVDDGTVVAG